MSSGVAATVARPIILSVKYDSGHSPADCDLACKRQKQSHNVQPAQKVAASNAYQVFEELGALSAVADRRLYYPNLYNKATCTNVDCDGLGRCGLCHLEVGHDKPSDASCWKTSYRWQMAKYKAIDGIFLQVIDGQSLGNGQILEAQWAQELGLTCFHTVTGRPEDAVPGLFCGLCEASFDKHGLVRPSANKSSCLTGDSDDVSTTSGSKSSFLSGEMDDDVSSSANTSSGSSGDSDDDSTATQCGVKRGRKRLHDHTT